METIQIAQAKTVERKPTPCQYSVSELNTRAQKAIDDYEAGSQLIPHELIKRK